jgi:hypothetical protein
MCPVIPTSNQDGHQAKNRKKGDDIFKKSSPLKLLSQSRPNFAEMILRTHFLRGATKGPFHKSLVAIGPVVSEEKIKM